MPSPLTGFHFCHIPVIFMFFSHVPWYVLMSEFLMRFCPSVCITLTHHPFQAILYTYIYINQLYGINFHCNQFIHALKEMFRQEQNHSLDLFITLLLFFECFALYIYIFFFIKLTSSYFVYNATIQLSRNLNLIFYIKLFY